jgi:hypothetical protein
MRIGGGNRSTRRKPAQCHYVHHKSHIAWLGIEPGPQQWETGDWPPERWHDLKQSPVWFTQLTKRVILYEHFFGAPYNSRKQVRFGRNAIGSNVLQDSDSLSTKICISIFVLHLHIEYTINITSQTDSYYALLPSGGSAHTTSNFCYYHCHILSRRETSLVCKFLNYCA